jgi:hypothetical protein
MRLTAIAIVMTLLVVVPASGQSPPPVQHPYGLDPYKPSDAALLRDYGATLVTQTPLLELHKLDPYKPSDAALLRQLGGGIPLWSLLWYPPVPASLTPFQTSGILSPPPVTGPVLLVGQLPTDAADAIAAPAAVAPPPPSSMATLRRPESNDGAWISYADQKWISAGPAVRFESSEFARVGQYGDFPVFKRPGASDEVIYVPSGEGLVAPYRLKP